MNSRNSQLRFGLAFAIVALVSSPLAFSGGFEKSLFFSGKYSGIAGSAASSVSGAESVFFNPAGLAGGDTHLELSTNFSPAIVKFSGPLAGNTSLDSKSGFVPAFGVFASYKVTEKLAFGFGTYLAGGANATFENVSFVNTPTLFGAAAETSYANSNTDIVSKLSIVDFAFAGAYEIIDGLRFGAEWRIVKVNAKLSTYVYSPTAKALNTVLIDGVSGTRFNGFRLGLQYYPREARWGLGATWRSRVDFSGEGDLTTVTTLGTGNAQGAPAGTKVNNAAGSKATLSSTFPQEFNLGGHYDILPNRLRAHLQYGFQNYSVNNQIGIAGNINATTPLQNLDLGWVNSHSLRFGVQCFELPGWAFRAGYVYASQVTPKDRARPVFTAPAGGHSFTLGAGTSFLNDLLFTDLALEYGFTNATVDAGNFSGDRTSGLPGDYKASVMAAHASVSLRL